MSGFIYQDLLCLNLNNTCNHIMLRIKTIILCSIIFCISCTESDNQIGAMYNGVIPCADCPGIEMSIRLDPGGTYQKKVFYINRDSAVRTFEGKYSLTEDSLLTLHGSSDIEYYRLSSSGLQMLDTSGSEIRTSLTTAYLLKPVPSETLRLPGEMNFQAGGNEPFWNLSIKPGSSIQINRMGEEELILPYSESVSSEIGKIFTYSYSDQKTATTIQLVERPCTDTMSGFLYAYTSSVAIRTADDREVLSGCARETGIDQLSGSWKVLRLNELNPRTSYPDSLSPEITLNTASGEINGFSGCNNFMGSFTEKNGSVEFSEFGATLRICQDMEFENAFLSVLSGRRFIYGFLMERLVLQNEETFIELERL